MELKRLGESDLEISRVGLGTMTFGQQNSEAQAHAQLDHAVACGVNFIDTAEMYPVPAKAETCGSTESIVGNWLRRQPRDRLVVATKVAGPARSLAWIRNGTASFDAANIRAAIEGSLRRLQTDYVDLYQLHWPDRNVPVFGQTAFDETREREFTPIRDQLEALARLVESGKVRHIGLSNEHPWGVMEFLRLSREHGLPRVASVQNAYSLLNRTYEHSLAEVGFRERVGLIAYSPLAMGHLTGKYLESADATGRITLFPGFGQRYTKENVLPATRAYVDIARRHGMSPATLALAFAASRRFVTSTLIGATTLEQLRENLAACDQPLNGQVLAEIEAIHLRFPNPAP